MAGPASFFVITIGLLLLWLVSSNRSKNIGPAITALFNGAATGSGATPPTPTPNPWSNPALNPVAGGAPGSTADGGGGFGVGTPGGGFNTGGGFGVSQSGFTYPLSALA